MSDLTKQNCFDFYMSHHISQVRGMNFEDVNKFYIGQILFDELRQSDIINDDD